jgi:hypothetical protein
MGLARRADACESSHYDVVALVAVVGGGYVATTATFAIKDVVTSNHSMSWGLAETAFNGTAMTIYGVVAVQQAERPYSDASAVGVAGVLAGLHGLLLAHGIYTIVKYARAPSQPDVGAMRVGPVKAVIAPSALPNGAGLGLSGVF